ncbi:MAG: hypothetical protein ACYC1L_02020 [Alphaproteobacteria bacterium]
MNYRSRRKTWITLLAVITIFSGIHAALADDPTEKTRTLLYAISNAIGEYRDRDGRLPAEDGKTLADALLKGSPPVLKLPPDRLNAKGEIIDFWGRPVRYRILPDQKYVVYSVGAYGRDEGGAGDDFGFQR